MVCVSQRDPPLSRVEKCWLERGREGEGGRGREGGVRERDRELVRFHSEVSSLHGSESEDDRVGIHMYVTHLAHKKHTLDECERVRGGGGGIYKCLTWHKGWGRQRRSMVNGERSPACH